MTWWSYVQRVAPGTLEAIARKIEVSQATVSRWRKSTPEPVNVAAFARAYNRPVLEAFVAAGFLTSDEAGEQPTAPPSLVGLNDDDLLAEVGRRLRRGGTNASAAAQEKSPSAGSDVGGGVAASVSELPRPTPEHYLVDRAGDDRLNQGRALRDHLDSLSDET